MAETTSEIPSEDVAKFPALFSVPRLQRQDPGGARLQLTEAVGFFFLARMLRSREAPPGCPPRFYQSVRFAISGDNTDSSKYGTLQVALSVLAGFTSDEALMTEAAVLFNIPELLAIIEHSDTGEEDPLLVNNNILGNQHDIKRY